MSKIGLNSTIYHITGKYLLLLNDFMVKIRHHQNDTRVIKNDEVKVLLEKILDEESIEPQIQMLNSIIEKELRKSNQPPGIFFKTLMEALNSKKYQDVEIKLKYIINALDHEHNQALAKIKGK